MNLLIIPTSTTTREWSNDFQSVYSFENESVCFTEQDVSEYSKHKVKQTIKVEATACFVVQKGGAFQSENPQVRVLLSRGRFLFVDVDEAQMKGLSKHNDTCWHLEPLCDYKVVSRAVKASPNGRLQLDRHFEIDKLRLERHLGKLCIGGTRFTFSNEYMEALRYCDDQLVTMGYEVERMDFEVRFNGIQRTTHNLVARKVGVVNAAKTFVVCAHLDSINKNGVDLDAPGSDDNASGSAGVLEIAQQLAQGKYQNSIEFVLFGAEELGLHGSKHYVAEFPSTKEIIGVINMDMIGRKNDEEFGLLIEGHSVSTKLVEKLSQIAANHTDLSVVVSFNPFNSDHVSFIEAGYPALLTIEGSDSANMDIHTEKDVLEIIDYELMQRILLANTLCVHDALVVANGLPS